MTPLENVLNICKRTLYSYGGTELWTRVAYPNNKLELLEVLRYAQQRGWSISFRAGEHSFDTQSLNEKLVVSLKHFGGVFVDPHEGTVRAGAGATWGEVLEKTMEFGFVPYALVTTSHASVGGTLSTNALSRFSPTLGREAQHVESFVVLTLDGKEHVCSRTKNTCLFQTVISGLGYVGAVLEVTHRLLRIGIPAERLAISTTFERVDGYVAIARRLVQHLESTGGAPTPAAQACQAVNAAGAPALAARAVSAAVYTGLGEEPVALIATSRYDDVPRTQRRRNVFHQPHSVLHWALQFLALFSWLRNLTYRFLFTYVYKIGVQENYQDDVPDYSFFEDGNRGLRYFMRHWGFPVGIRQQAYVIPWGPNGARPPGQDLGLFMQAAKETFSRAKVSPVLVDVLYLPDDAGDTFWLSSSDQSPGFIVTFTFERLWSAEFPREETAFADLARECESLGGWVHLPKTVSASPDVIRRMYADGITAMHAVREAVHATPLTNEFRARVLPDL